MDKDLKHCIRWLRSIDDLDYAYDNIRLASDYFNNFNNLHGLDPKFSDSKNSIRSDFCVLCENFKNIYDLIYSITEKIKSLEHGQTGA